MALIEGDRILIDRAMGVAQWLKVAIPKTLPLFPWDETLSGIMAALLCLERKPKSAIPKAECIRLRQRAQELHQRTSGLLDQKFIDDFRQLITDIIKWYRQTGGSKTVVEP